LELVFATNNLYKVKEVQDSVPADLTVRTLSSIGCEHEIEETAPDLVGNARIKAEHVFHEHGCEAFADDTGLEVKALNGRPGVHSARYAGSNPSFLDNIDKLLEEMEGMKDRKARFRTVILLRTERGEEIFEGTVMGHITESPRGRQGFGYDPVFVPEGEERTFAEMEAEEKERIGHRGEAVRKLGEFLRKEASSGSKA
jgi:XTP/dITP diphosphohydrolase